MLNPAVANVEAIAAPGLDPLFLRPQRTGVESAWYGHVPFAHWLVAAAQPRLLVELGTHNGVSYSAFCEAIARFGHDCRAFAVDTWEGDEHAGHYGNDVFPDLQRFHNERYGGFSELLRCTFNDALPYFADGSVDLLHIDGLHTYEAVREDWKSWRHKLSSRAVVLFHDTNVRERGFGVWRLWAELSAAHPHFEFFHAHGLGVLTYGPNAPAQLAELCALRDARAASAVRQRFALLGERWVEASERRGNISAQQRAEAALAGAAVQAGAAQAEAQAREAELQRATEAAASLGEALADAEAAAAAEREAAAARLAAALEASGRDVAAGAEQIDVLQGQIAEMELEMARLWAEQSAARATVLELARAQEAVAARNAELAAMRAHYHAVVSSTSWRATQPVRQLGQRFPGVARQAMRAVRLGAATVTGKLPEQLRLRRRVREDAALIGASPLFDCDRYLRRYPDVAQAGADPLWHYIWSGATAGYDPHPLFDGRWYLSQHPEVEAAGANPLAHYLREGAAAGYDPHPLFDTAHYVQQEPDGAGNALLHYLQTGAGRARNPNPCFDMDGYWNDYLDNRDTSDDPLSHYVLRGAAAGFDPHPSFDTDWYAATYPDSAGSNPLAHYLHTGRDKGYAPSLLARLCGGEIPTLRLARERNPVVSIIVPTYGRLFDTLRCLNAIAAHSGDAVPYEVLVVDDRPDAPIARQLRGVPGLRVELNARNLGFLHSCKRAADAAVGRYLLFLNNDTTVHPGWLEPLVRLAEADSRVGMVGAKLLNADGTVQEAGGTVHRNGWGEPYGGGRPADSPEYGFVREVDVVIGACMLVRQAAWDAVGGFDERYAPAYYEEFDLAFALRDQGWRVMYQPASQVTHFDSASYGPGERERQSTINHAQFCRKWAKALQAQPASGTAPYIARERPMRGRILVVDDRVPEPDKHAGAMATFDWLRLLSGMGWRVTYKPHDQARPEPYTVTLQQMGVEVLYGPVDMPAWLAENGRHLDWVWLARPGVAEPLLDAVNAHAPGKLIYFTHDLHFLREQRRYELEGAPWHRDEARRLRRIEGDIFRRAHRVLTPSADEVKVIQSMAPGVDARAIPLYTVPLSPVAPRRAEDFAARRTVLFVGGYDHPPNVDAARWLATEIMPQVWDAVPDARLVLAGSKPGPDVLALAGERVDVPGWLPDLGPLYAEARLSLSPLRYGAGVKGKIVASLQAGVPVVTTSIGNEGLGLQPGAEALIGDLPGELARHAVSLLQDAALCVQLADAGAATVRCRFGEDALRGALLSALERELCPVCGRFGSAPEPVRACEPCGATDLERALAGAAIRPCRAAGVASLREAAPLLGRVSMPPGPLADAAPGAGGAGLDLLVALAEPDGSAVRPGGRVVTPASGTASLRADGWTVLLHEAGLPVAEAIRPMQSA